MEPVKIINKNEHFSQVCISYYKDKQKSKYDKIDYMKIPVIIFFLSVILVPETIGISFAQTYGAISEDESELTGSVGAKIPRDRADIMENPPDVLLQLILRDSDGNLLAYTETKENMAFRPLYLMSYLDDIPNKKIIIKDGKQVELIQFEKPEPTVQHRHTTAMYVLMA